MFIRQVKSFSESVWSFGVVNHGNIIYLYSNDFEDMLHD